MARKNPYDAPAIPPFGSPLPLGGAVRSGPPPDDQTEVALRRSRGKGVLPVDDETNFGDLESAIAGGGELEAEVLKVDPRALAQRLASATPEESTHGGRRGLADDEPTLLGGPAGPAMDPKELARILAAKAKTRLGITNPPEAQPAPPPVVAPVAPIAPAAPPESPVLGAVASPVDPVALARKLAAEAKARMSAEPPPPRAEDPVALARRLAAEAKARMTPPPAGPRAPSPHSTTQVPRVDPAPLASPPARTPPPSPPRASTTPPAPARLAPPPASRAVAPPDDVEPWEDAPAPQPTSRVGRLADRAPRQATRTSAADALKRLTDSPAPPRQSRPAHAVSPPAGWDPEPEPEVEPEAPEAPYASDPSGLEPVDVSPVEPSALPDPRWADAEPVTAPAPPPRVHNPEDHLRQIAEVFPDAIVESERPVRRPAVFRALWEAHQARALKDGHLELAGAATLLLTMIDRLPPGGLIGVKITRAGKGWAVFVDAADGAILAVVPRPEVYLAGLQ